MTTVRIYAVPGVDTTALRSLLGRRPATMIEVVQANSAGEEDPEDASVTVLIVADPHRCAERLTGRSERSMVLALAGYERYLRRALPALDGRRSVIASDAEAPVDIAAAIDDLEEGRPAHLAPRARPAEPTPSASIPPAIDHLWSLCQGLIGAYESFPAPALGREDEWTTEVLALAAELHLLERALLFTAEQLASIMEIEPDPELPLHRSDWGEEPDQFHEAGEGEPYRLNASEDRRAYQEWLTWKRQPGSVGGRGDAPIAKAATRARRRKSPLVSVVVPVYKTPIWALQRCVGSVLAQRFPDWELLLSDDGSNDAELTAALRGLAHLDRRISVITSPANAGISDATNRGVAASSGEFIAFLDHDDELAPEALAKVAEVIERDASVDLIYSDEDKIDVNGERFDPFFKPDWSPDLLLSFAYLSHLTVIRRSLFLEMGGLRSDFDGSQDYDLTLRASESARSIVHIPEVLYHWRNLPGSAAADNSERQAKPWAYEAGRRVLEDTLARRGESGEVTMIAEYPGRYHVRRSVIGRPLVSIIIPFRDEPSLLATCTRTLRSAPGYDNFEILLVDNDSALPETRALLEELVDQPGVKILESPGPFNWAAINNSAAKASSGDLLLFMNNDIEARVPGWLDAMVGHAQRPEVGAVGARLLYPDGTIQHAGVVIGLGGIAGHVLRGLPGDRPGYASLAISTRDCSVITGAAMMVRRDVFLEVGGFDETLAVAFNDVDFCLKLRDRGYLVVFSPLAELIHHESKSRGHTDDFAENKLMLSRWRDAMLKGDPYHSVHLSHWRYWCPLSTAQEDDRWKNYLETRILTLDSSSSE